MAKEKTAEFKMPEVFIKETSNKYETDLVDSIYATNEPFKLKVHTTEGIDGNGKESVNVSLSEKLGLQKDLQPRIMEVADKFIDIKLVLIKKGDNQYSIIYDNATKKPFKTFKKEDDKMIEVSENDYIVAPSDILGKTYEERLKVIDALILMVKNGANSQDQAVREQFLNALRNSIGSLSAKGINIRESLSTLYEKTEFLKEVLGKVDFNNPNVKSYYKNYRDYFEEEKDLILPKITLFTKEKEKFLSSLTPMQIRGISFKDFRALTKTISEENADVSEKAEFKEIENLKKEQDIKINVLNANVRNIGIDETGNIVVFDDFTIPVSSNGDIYKNKGLYDKLKDIESAIKLIEQAVWDDENKIDFNDLLKAENTLKEKANLFVEKEEFESGKEYLTELIKNLDVNKLYSKEFKEKINMRDKFREVFNYLKKKILIENRNVVLSDKILTQKGDRIRQLPYSSHQKESLFKVGDLDKEYIKNNIKEYAILASIPILREFNGKLFLKEFTAKTFSIYYDENENRIRQIETGANISKYKKIANLGVMIDNIRNYSSELAEKHPKKFEKIDTGIAKYLVKDNKNLELPENFKRVIEAIKPQLSELVNLLREKKYNEAKELVASWDKSENNNLKVFTEWTKRATEEFERNKIIVNVAYLANTNKQFKELITQPLEKIKENKDMFISQNNKDLRKARKSIISFLEEFETLRKAVALQKENHINKMYEINEKLDENRVKYNSLDAIAKNLGFSLKNHYKTFYLDKNGNLGIYKTFKPFMKTEGDIIKKEEIDFNNKNVYVSVLDKDLYDKFMNEKREVIVSAEDVVKEEFEELKEFVNEKLEKPKKVEGEAISFGDIDIDFDDIEINAKDIEIGKTKEEPLTKQDEVEEIDEEIEELEEIDNNISFGDILGNEDEDYGIDEDEDVFVSPDAVLAQEEEKSSIDIKQAQQLGI